jgi:hypothetical protein
MIYMHLLTWVGFGLITYQTRCIVSKHETEERMDGTHTKDDDANGAN